MNPFKIGDKVKLTGKFLKNTGQVTGGEGQSTWTVTGFWGGEGGMDFVITDESSDLDGHMRSIHFSNLFKVGTLTTKNCP